MWHGTHSFTCVKWLIHSEETHSRLICVTLRQAFTRSYVWLEVCVMGSSHLFICVTGHSLMHEWVKKKTCTNVWVPWKNGWVLIHEWVKNKCGKMIEWVKKKGGTMSECPSYVWQGTHEFICMTRRRKKFYDASFSLVCSQTRKWLNHNRDMKH